MLVGFTAVYREGFETALFYQSLLTFGPGLGAYVALGIGLGVVALAVVAYAMFRLGRKMPIKVFMNIAVAFVMTTSVAFLGNAVHTLQSADVVPYTVLAAGPAPRSSSPRPPATGRRCRWSWPSSPSPSSTSPAPSTCSW